MSDVTAASPKFGEFGHHHVPDGSDKQLQAPQAGAGPQTSPHTSMIGQINGFSHRGHVDACVDKSDSEAETVVLSGKEEGLDHQLKKSIKLEEENVVDHQSNGLAVVHERQQEAIREEGLRQSSLKRKRPMPDRGHNDRRGSGNSSNLSSTVSSPAPQANSVKAIDTASNRSRSSPPFDEVTDEQEGRDRRADLEKGKTRGYGRGGNSDRASEPVNGRKRRDTRSATHYDEPSHRSESPPSRHNNRAQSIQSNHLHSGVAKRRKVPASLYVERRRKASEDTHLESDDDSSVHSHRQLQKVPLANNNAVSSAKMVSHKKNRDRSGQTLLARACRSGDVLEVGKWLKERPQDLDVPDYAENTPLQIAALEGNTEVVQLLLEACCDTNCRNIDKETPLIDAVENGHLGVVQLLLKAGLDPRQTNAKGQEPLDLVNPDLDDADEIRDILHASKKEKALLRRPSEDHNRQQGLGSRDIDMTPGNASSASPVISSRSPPPVGPAAKRRTARSQVTDDALLWVNATPARLRDAAGKGEGKIVDHILKMRPQADTESILAAARGGHEDVLGLMLAIATTDPDPEPLRSMEYKPADSTPILAAIGRGNISIINLLLSQAGFDPTRRRYKGMTYYEIARERQGADWQEEHDVLKEAYDSYKQHGGRKSNKNSPRRVRVKRADSSKSVSEPSSSPHEPRKTRKPSTLTEQSSDGKHRESTHNGVALKNAGENKKQSASPLASDHESRPRGLPKKAKEGKASVEKSPSTSKRADSLKPKRRLMSGNDFRSNQDMKRRASLTSDTELYKHESGQAHGNRQRRFSDVSEPTPMVTSEEPSNSRGEMGKKRHRTSVSPQASKPDLAGNVDHKQKKRQRVDSHGSAIDQDGDRSFRPGAPATIANMIAGTSGQSPSTVPQGTAPVAFMGSIVTSPVTKSPTDSYPRSATLPLPNSGIDQAHPQRPDHESLQAEKRVEQIKIEQERVEQELERQATEANEKAIQEEEEKRRHLKAEQERTAQAEREAAEREARVARQREEARLEEQRQAAEAERQMLHLKEQEEARLAKMKRDEELHQRRIEQERLRKEDQERKRREMEERENLRRVRLQEEEERQRLQSLPNGLRRAAELGVDEARTAKEIVKWFPLRTVTTQELDPECEPTVAEERWIANLQAAPILAIKDLDLSQYTAWTRFPATMNHRGSLWRQLRRHMSQAVPNPFLTPIEAFHLDEATRPKFFDLRHVFWIKLADFMDIVPRHLHLAGLQFPTRAMVLHEFPFGKGGGGGGGFEDGRGAEEVVKVEAVSPVLNGGLMNGCR